MANKSNPHPHVAWRDGRPRFMPGAKLREAGHKGFDLRHPDGRQLGYEHTRLAFGHGNTGPWFTRGQCVDWSAAFCAALAGRAAKAARKPRRAVYTVQDMLHDWQSPTQNVKFDVGKTGALAPKTMNEYRVAIRCIERVQPSFYGASVMAIDTPLCRALYERIWDVSGLSMANATLRMLSAAFSWAILKGKPKGIAVNPAKNIRMQQTRPRLRIATRGEIAAMVEAADDLRMHHIGDCIIMAVWTGQRQGDRLAAQTKGVIGNRRYFRQSKTGAIVAIAQAPQFEQRLDAARARRKALGLISPYVILNEETGQPFHQKAYNVQYRAVRAHAIKRSGLASLATLNDQDLRDTAVTWLATAGSTIPEICAITGHSLGSATTILKHYLSLDPAMADSAITKMITWYDGGGDVEMIG